MPDRPLAVKRAAAEAVRVVEADPLNHPYIEMAIEGPVGELLRVIVLPHGIVLTIQLQPERRTPDGLGSILVRACSSAPTDSSGNPIIE